MVDELNSDDIISGTEAAYMWTSNDTLPPILRKHSDLLEQVKELKELCQKNLELISNLEDALIYESRKNSNK